MSVRDLALQDLSTVADAIASGKTTSVEATEACLDRIEFLATQDQRIPSIEW